MVALPGQDPVLSPTECDRESGHGRKGYSASQRGPGASNAVANPTNAGSFERMTYVGTRDR